MPDDGAPPSLALRLIVSGRVQGVGFRPFVHRLAVEQGLAGWVRNVSGRVEIHAEGAAAALARFQRALIDEAPPLARPALAAVAPVACAHLEGFTIRNSAASGPIDAHLPPDLFTCDACLAEMADPAARRFRYPFTNCTQCGPRYTIVRALPYDRPATTMAGFALCPDCAREYADPADRRHHAQPLACPACGPALTLREGARITRGDEAALAGAVRVLRAGGIVAVKGIGGYHLMCDARSAAATARLRARKHRPDKPLAVMVAQAGADLLDAARALVVMDPAQAAALRDPARPIVLCAIRSDAGLPGTLAPGLAQLGVFLPYSPLHHLLLGDFGGPLVATSGNVSGEPVLTEAAEAAARLAGVADAFLDHDRSIARPADDSVVHLVAGRIRPIRLGRGAAPVELRLPGRLAAPVLALGGQGKVAPALGWGDRIVLGPHVGDLDSARALDTLASVCADLARLHGVTPARIAHDAHPGYAGTAWARKQAAAPVAIWHHHAHASALTLERPDAREWLIFTWDAVGLGPDGALWGGEALAGGPGRWTRVAGWRTFRPVGGEAAARAPWRSAAALCWAMGRDMPRAVAGIDLARAAWTRGVNCPTTGAVGRLLDGVACLALGIDTVSFEGAAPMRLEAAAQGQREPIRLPLTADADGLLRTDWAPLVAWLLDSAEEPGARAATAHATLVAAALAQYDAVAATRRFDAVGFCGGVAQNRLLAEGLAVGLAARGVALTLAEAAPANDGGLAVGQIVECLARDSAARRGSDKG